MAKQSRTGNGRADLDAFRVRSDGTDLTTNQGVPIADNQNTLRAGERGPSLLEDFIMREKITHFDHERIPERVVHARGAAAHGTFQVYESLEKYTRARFLCDPSLRTPVFVRFSTVGGSRGSADTVRDVRGFATKFYTPEGIFDLVGNNMPVFFIQDAIKFPDFVHAVKPEPQHEIPQASSAHDTFWDFVSLTPESTHMVMWLMSDRALPRAYANMEGFGVHTFRLLNAAGESTFVKFHWKPLAGLASLLWDETQKLAGKDPDFNRRQLWESIETGNFLEYELGLQLFDDKQADAFDFDVLDPTKIIPEELVPVRRVGKLTLNRNPDNFFAETEQVAFCISHVVPGIDFSNDPLLQGRLFSYLDTQLSRLGGPNFHQIPINRPVCPFRNGQQDGFHQMEIRVGRTAYDPNSVDGGWPKEKPVEQGGFESYLEQLRGDKRRVRAESFKEHFSQATLFWNSQTDVEKEHIVSAFGFELAKVERPEIRERVLGRLANVDADLTARVAAQLGLEAPSPSNDDGAPRRHNGKSAKRIEASAALSIIARADEGTAKGRKVAILAADGVDGAALTAMKTRLTKAGVQPIVISARLGTLTATDGTTVPVDHTILTMPSVVFDGVYVPGGDDAVAALAASADAIHFVAEAYKHLKPIAAAADAVDLLRQASLLDSDATLDPADGLFVGTPAKMGADFTAALAAHRVWTRTDYVTVPA